MAVNLVVIELVRRDVLIMGLFNFTRNKPASLAIAVTDMTSEAMELIKRGQVLEDQGKFEAAHTLYLQAVGLAPRLPQSHLNLGNVLLALKQPDAARDAYLQSLALKPDWAPAHFNLGNTYIALKNHHQALHYYELALAQKPDFVDALIARGYVLHADGKFRQALHSYEQALALNPNHVGALCNCALTWMKLSDPQQALLFLDQALAIQPNFVDAHHHRAMISYGQKEFDPAIRSFDRVLSLNPVFELTHGLRLHAKMALGNWQDHDQDLEALFYCFEQGTMASTCFPMLSLSASARLQLRFAERWIQNRFPTNPLLGPVLKHANSGKIRIGYFSTDFHNHPVSFLMAGIFETHNRDAFEIYAFYFGPDIRDEMRTRLETAFDHFLVVSDQSALEIAQLARRLRIDIAVDLVGHTSEARTDIFALRAAPIQVNYLGFPGTMGADYMDYMIVDSVTTPPEYRKYYKEHLIYLPCFQANDSRRITASRTPCRAELGLPATGFVFCCFNNSYKINPAIFDLWMRLLHQIDGSVLYLLGDRPELREHLRLESKHRGIAPERLIFGDRVSIPDYLSRFQVADLFLDTYPFNAGTTASDALWAGLPVLTCTGESFASRMAASLLQAIGLPELITHNFSDYEAMALRLANDPHLLATLRNRLLTNRDTTILFNTQTFVSGLEKAFLQVHTRHLSGQSPADVVIDLAH